MSSKSDFDDTQPRDDTRREFIRGSSLLLASAFPRISGARPLRVGLLGCDQSGLRMASLAMSANLPVQLVALGDEKQGNLVQAKRTLKGRFSDRFAVAPDSVLVGEQAARKFLTLDLDLAILARPIAELPTAVWSCLAKGTHCYTEAPLLSDAGQIGEEFYRSDWWPIAGETQVPGKLAVGSRRQLDYRFPVREGLSAVGRPLRLRFQETLVSCHSQDLPALQRIRADHLALALRICQLNDPHFHCRSIELREVITDGGAQLALFQLGDETELLSRITMGQREFRSYEVVGVDGRCDFEKKRCWNNLSNEVVRLPEPTTSKAARQQHMDDFLRQVAISTSSGRSKDATKEDLKNTLQQADLVARACRGVSLPLG